MTERQEAARGVHGETAADAERRVLGERAALAVPAEAGRLEEHEHRDREVIGHARDVDVVRPDVRHGERSTGRHFCGREAHEALSVFGSTWPCPSPYPSSTTGAVTTDGADVRGGRDDDGAASLVHRGAIEQPQGVRDRA